VGPIAHSISDLRYVISTILDTAPWFHDPKCIELPWRTDHVDYVKGRPLTFGIIKWDNLTMPHPPVQRAIRIVKEALRAQGHELIDFEVPDSHEAERLTVFCNT
jgi:amidase